MCIRDRVYQLRQMGAELVVTSDGVELKPQDVHVDYDTIVAAETIRPAHLEATLGGFLPGFAPAHSEAFAEWYDAFRARSLSNLSRALLKEINRARSAGEWDITEQAARACLAVDPLNEAATLALAEMLALGGAKARAVRLLDDFMEEVG